MAAQAVEKLKRLKCGVTRARAADPSQQTSAGSVLPAHRAACPFTSGFQWQHQHEEEAAALSRCHVNHLQHFHVNKSSVSFADPACVHF